MDLVLRTAQFKITNCCAQRWTTHSCKNWITSNVFGSVSKKFVFGVKILRRQCFSYIMDIRLLVTLGKSGNEKLAVDTSGDKAVAVGPTLTSFDGILGNDDCRDTWKKLLAVGFSDTFRRVARIWKRRRAFLREWEKCKRPWPEFSLFLNQNHTVCPNIEKEFLGKFGNSNVFSAQNQVISKKKGLHRNWDWFFG